MKQPREHDIFLQENVNVIQKVVSLLIIHLFLGKGWVIEADDI